MFQKGCELMSRERKFPLVDDNDVVVAVPKTMRLYENEDLITNIHGPYEDKVYNDVTQDYQFIPDNPNPQKVASDRLVTQKAGKTYAELAREEARWDLKKKRQSLITNDYPKSVSRTSAKKSEKATKAPKNELGRFSDHLHQDTYILAELPKNYSEPKNPSRKENKKNNYDFLKTSQIYNQKEKQEYQERHVAQELNLERFEDVN